MRIEYDPRKAASNLKKHKVSFEEAVESLHDRLARVISDPDCEGEERYILIGMSNSRRILLVIYAYRDEDDVIRIISARKATAREATLYA
jgi:hypothetical protein